MKEQIAAERMKLNWEAEDRAAVLATYKELLRRRPGRKFLWNLLGQHNIGHQPFTANALTTAFNCGLLDGGQRILADILEADPEGYVRMQKEMSDEQRTRTSSIANTGTNSDTYSLD